MDPLQLIDTWPVDHAAAAVVAADTSVSSRGDTSRVFHLASLSKILTSWAALVAVEEGSVSLADPVGQPGCTLRHLLAHAGGYGFDGTSPITAPGRRRIYSNTGIELAAAAVEQATGIAFEAYLVEAVLQPLGMTTSELRGSAAHGMWSSVDDVTALLCEIRNPTLLSEPTVADATTVQFPDLDGMVPGVGVFRPCPWGLGVEIHGGKAPHWMGVLNSAATFGHFGGSGTMTWVDPAIDVAVVALTDRPFDQWGPDAVRLWSAFSDAVVSAAVDG